MKYILSIFVFILLSFNKGEAQKKYQPYWSIILESDLIIDGTITDLKDTIYSFEIIDFVKGKSKKKINVNIWKEWSCDHRPRKLQDGLRLVLFLEKQLDGSYNVIHGSNGELFVNKDKSISPIFFDGFTDVYDVKYGIDKFLKSFDYLRKKDYDDKSRHVLKRKISKLEMDKIMNSSNFFKHVINQIKRNLDTLIK